MGIQKFNARMIQNENMNASYIEIPFDVEEVFGAKRVKVKALLDGFEYRGSIVRMKTKCHILGITQEMRTKMGKTFGDMVTVELQKDEDVRAVILPDDFSKILSKNEKAQSFYNTLSFSNQNNFCQWIESAKKEETRQKRIHEAIQKLEKQEKLK